MALEQPLQDILRLAVVIRVAQAPEPLDPILALESARVQIARLRDRLTHWTGQISAPPEMVRRWMMPPRTDRAARLTEWALSRSALAEAALSALEASAAHVGGARLLLSLAHTQGLAVAAAIPVAPGERLRPMGLGVDVELSDRAVGPRVAARFSHPDDEPLDLTAIQCWAVKEACHKADPEATGHYAGYRLRARFGEDAVRRAEVQSDRADFRVAVLGYKAHVVAVCLAFPALAQAVVEAEEHR